ncbi:hypothetical protein ACWDYH_00175 [Nocardia goodfellowii]
MSELDGYGPVVPSIGSVQAAPTGGVLVPSVGPRGLEGPKGDKGDIGPQGEGLEIDGQVSAYAELPASAPDGATWLAGGKLYRRTAGLWPAENTGTMVQGPPGIQGIQGIQGPIGPQGVPGTTDWSGLTNRPSTFPPSAHTHPIVDVTGLQTTLDAKEVSSAKGQANGYAPLDANSTVPPVYLPSYVDDVLEYTSASTFPATGETGKIYLAIDTGKIYRWGGSTYGEISPSPGSTDAVPEGASNKYYTDSRVSDRVAAMFGNTAGTVTQGNDPRLADSRTPSAGTVPCDFVWVSHSGNRAAGTGDIGAMYVGRAFIADSVTYQFDTADASGTSTVEIRRNGTQVVGSQLAVTAANQVDGTATDPARSAALTDSSRSYAIGDRFALALVTPGTTPGKGLRVYVKGRWA